MNYRIALVSTLFVLASLTFFALPSCSSCSSHSSDSTDSGVGDSTGTATLASLDSIVVEGTYYEDQNKKSGPSLYASIVFRYLAGDSTLERLFSRIAFGDQYASLSPRAAVDTYIRDMSSEYTIQDQYSQEMSQEDLNELKSDLRLSTKIGYIDSLVISVHKDLAEYYAGAVHGNYGTGFYNIDRRTKTLLRESDYFVEDYAAQLTKILQRRLLIGYKVKTLEELEEKEGISAVDLTPNDNCSIGPKGLTYIYNPYEIGPYALGQVTIFVPYEDLQPILRPGSILSHYLPH
jgi:hypothetical protein